MRQPSKENPIKILRFADKRLWCFRGTMEEAWEFARKKRTRAGREMRRDQLKGGCKKLHPPMTIDSQKHYIHCTICSSENQRKN